MAYPQISLREWRSRYKLQTTSERQNIVKGYQASVKLREEKRLRTYPELTEDQLLAIFDSPKFSLLTEHITQMHRYNESIKIAFLDKFNSHGSWVEMPFGWCQIESFLWSWDTCNQFTDQIRMLNNDLNIIERWSVPPAITLLGLRKRRYARDAELSLRHKLICDQPLDIIRLIAKMVYLKSLDAAWDRYKKEIDITQCGRK
jgi:hypothetical protein